MLGRCLGHLGHFLDCGPLDGRAAPKPDAPCDAADIGLIRPDRCPDQLRHMRGLLQMALNVALNRLLSRHRLNRQAGFFKAERPTDFTLTAAYRSAEDRSIGAA